MVLSYAGRFSSIASASAEVNPSFNYSLLPIFVLLPHVFHFFIFFPRGPRGKYKEMEDVRMQGNVVNNESLNVKRILLLLKRNFKTFYCSAKAFKAIPIRPVFSNNMGTKSEPVISKCKESENWTKVSFQPDLAKFNMTHLKDDMVALLEKWVFDLAGCLRKSVKVLNGTQFPIKSSRDYVNLYLDSAAKSKPDKPPSYHVKVNDRWEICVSLSHRQFQQISKTRMPTSKPIM
ncbi:DNA topoisomerase 2-like isoform X2 [Quercus suber]|uniref:DNA topoisomerase 2-like isoform X2 n=1 Tax=Quercus suber TaxID=58331 RepID=UPI0032DF3397